MTLCQCCPVELSAMVERFYDIKHLKCGKCNQGTILFIYFIGDIVALWVGVSFCYTVKWISYMYIYIPSLLDRLPTPTAPSHLSAAAKSLQLCPTLCDPIDGSPLGSPVPGILQARTLEWVVISFSDAWKWKVKVKSFSHVRLLTTPWTVAHQAPSSMGFSRQEYWSGVPFPPI